MGVTCSLTLREERSLRLFENRVLRRLFWPKRIEVTGECSKLHNEELSDLYSTPNIIRLIKSIRMKWEEHVARMEERRDAYLVLMGKPERKGLLGRPWCITEDNIKKDILEVEWGSWTD
jgi:hypothetical protein